MLNEAHGNGTPLTTNGTRLWRYILGDDWSAGHQTTGRVRLFGSDEAYRQSFSSVTSVHTNRDTEALTRLQHVHTQELGASTDATVAFSRIAFVAGADVRDIRGTDYENPIKANAITGIFDASARQRFVGGFGEALASAHHGLFKDFSAALSLRLDSAANLDTRTITQTNPAPVPPAVPTANRSEFIASPRFGLVRQVTSRATIHAAVFRAFRTPTMNELYRTGQIGPQTTQANPNLLSERATGWETGTTFTTRPAALSATYFWTEINRPVAAVLIVAPNTYKRENLGQIVSQGTELRLDLYRSKPISATVGYQYSHAIVTRYNPPPPTQSLVGNWIPDVPRQNFTAQLRAANRRLGEAHPRRPRHRPRLGRLTQHQRAPPLLPARPLRPPRLRPPLVRLRHPQQPPQPAPRGLLHPAPPHPRLPLPRPGRHSLPLEQRPPPLTRTLMLSSNHFHSLCHPPFLP